MPLNIPKVARAGYTLYHPFLGLTSWKYNVPASALYHSVTVSVIAGNIAELLAENEDEIDMATYGGLVHDLYQKGRTGGLTKETSREIIRKTLGEEGLDEKIIGEVLESANYNV
ncbi:MAG: hypothetical protein ACK4H7_03830, partial [Acidilobaceae archaeon]